MAKFWGHFASGWEADLARSPYQFDASSLFARYRSSGNTIAPITPNPDNYESYSLVGIPHVIQILKSADGDITDSHNTKATSAYTINLHMCHMAITKPTRAPNIAGTPNLVSPFRLNCNTLSSKYTTKGRIADTANVVRPCHLN